MAMPADFQLRVFRWDPELPARPHYQIYTVSYRKGMTVQEALLWVLDHLDGSLAVRYSCREAICGTCAVYISGSYRLACRTQVTDTLEHGVVTVDPLPHLPVIKDLVVDMTNFFANYQQVKPWLIHDGELPEREFLVSPEERLAYNSAVDCILCGACHASCPAVAGDERYLGPHAILAAGRWLVDSRDTADAERTAMVSHEFGIFRCHTAFNCVESCPKEINQAEMIQTFKQRLLTGKAGKAGKQG